MSVVSDYTVISELRDILENRADFVRYLSSRSKRVPINEMVNQDFNKAPWCGIYHRGSVAEANTLPKGFKDVISMALVLQASSTCKKTCFEKLASMVMECKQAVIDNRTIGNKVDQLTGQISTNYTYIDTEQESLYFQMATIEIQAEVRVNAAR